MVEVAKAVNGLFWRALRCGFRVKGEDLHFWKEIAEKQFWFMDLVVIGRVKVQWPESKCAMFLNCYPHTKIEFA